jgi:hypothetical protein
MRSAPLGEIATASPPNSRQRNTVNRDPVNPMTAMLEWLKLMDGEVLLVCPPLPLELPKEGGNHARISRPAR